MVSKLGPSGQTLAILTVATAVVLTPPLASSCSRTATAAKGKTTLSISLTDAPGLRDALIEITGIYLEGAEGEDQVWLLRNPTGLIDLLSLADGSRTLVRDADVPAGEYSQLRFVFGNAVIVTDEGGVYATPGIQLSRGLKRYGLLRCPNCNEAGFPVTLPDGRLKVDKEVKDLIVDFDVRNSFVHAATRSSQWEMRPVLYASDPSESGRIAGRISLASDVTLPECASGSFSFSQFVPLAVSGEFGKPGVVRPDGSYSVSFLQARDYTLQFSPQIRLANGETLTLEALHPARVEVDPAEISPADYVITGMACRQDIP